MYLFIINNLLLSFYGAQLGQVHSSPQEHSSSQTHSSHWQSALSLLESKHPTVKIKLVKRKSAAIKVNVFFIILSLLKFFVIRLFLLRLLGGIVGDHHCQPSVCSCLFQSGQIGWPEGQAAQLDCLAGCMTCPMCQWFCQTDILHRP